MIFSFTFTIVVQFAILKVYFLCTLKNKKGKYIFFLKLNETDISLYFLTLEKVSVSLPTKSYEWFSFNRRLQVGLCPFSGTHLHEPRNLLIIPPPPHLLFFGQ